MSDIDKAHCLVVELRESAPRFVRSIKNSILATANQLERAIEAGGQTPRQRANLRFALVRAEQQVDLVKKMDGVKGAATPKCRNREAPKT
ncbi:hypothetical protein K2X14_00295 [Acetobacter sp. TBRC 12305]|uniref:Uncharacterized protein n=1 Tax=Acetobacter garciniae TaxID=2817435 RepID=A0A939HL24_9PROT|nr:hypothetical protein [Acetobacter garciniae]MBO1323594.1 hypothetical protein [Acetobacter garciniae]MBX0343283.1 hypothetical protein [Acetobacter garciniae]